jgi:hypothetical protein
MKRKIPAAEFDCRSIQQKVKITKITCFSRFVAGQVALRI